MGLVNPELLRQIWERNDKNYAVHRWALKAGRQVINACLKELVEEWVAAIPEWKNQNASKREV
jgi:hypothetical protein